METDYLTLYHFAGWPEGGVVQSPRDVASLVHLLLATREQQTVAAVSDSLTRGAPLIRTPTKRFPCLF